MRRGRTSGRTGAGAHECSSFVQCRYAGPVNLVVRQNGGTFDETVILCGINGF